MATTGSPTSPMNGVPRWIGHLTLTVLLVLGLGGIVAAGSTIAVVDGITNVPIPIVQILDQTQPSPQDQPGVIHQPPHHAGRSLTITAPGYQSAQVQVALVGSSTVKLEPIRSVIEVRDAQTDAPLERSRVTGPTSVEPAGPGRFAAWPMVNTELTITAPGYEDVRITTSEAWIIARLARATAGQVVHAQTGAPVPTAVIARDAQLFSVSPQGEIPVEALGQTPAWVLAPGFARESITRGGEKARVALRPQAVRGLYLTIYAVGDQTLRGNVDRLLQTTEANAVVIDVKGDRGNLSYRSSVPLADAIGANSAPTIPNVAELLGSLRQRGVYSIARIVVFKDDRLARNGPAAGLDLAVRDAATGDVWVDGEGLGWVDPFRTEAWDYNVELAAEAARLGFDEVQFDYIHFPTDAAPGGSVQTATFSQPLTAESRVRAITGILERARPAVNRHGAFLGIDTFGYTPWDEGDLGIGQALEYLAPHVDYICPMIYPSTFNAGLPGMLGFPGVVNDPYRTVLETTRRAVTKAEGRGAVIRPWLQYFDDYPWQTRRRYEAADIRAQIRASDEAGGLGWMLWDPSNRFDRGGLAPKR